MRSSLTILAVVAAAWGAPAFALETSDTMAAWKGASVADKSKLVTAILKRDGGEGETAKVIKCLDAAADVPGHGDLPIVQVVKACEKTSGQPV